MKNVHLAGMLKTTVLAAVMLGFGPPWAGADDTIKTGDPVKGKQVYLAVGCFECHGRAGQGGAYTYQTPPLAQIELPVDSFIAVLRAAPNDMPTYSVNVLTDQDAADIHACSLPGRKPVKDFPLLNQ
jgi:mono/diheme cytochrome c family protein